VARKRDFLAEETEGNLAFLIETAYAIIADDRRIS
jgi:hypothetical protein